MALENKEAERLNVRSLEDFEKLHPGRIDAIQTWFRTYKSFEGKKDNEFMEDGKIFDKLETLKTIFECN